VATDGLKGLFGRGLKTRIISNGLQGLLFSILWKLFLDLYVPSPKFHWKAYSYVLTQVGFEDWKIDLLLFVDLRRVYLYESASNLEPHYVRP